MSFIEYCIKTALLCIAVFAALSAVLMLSIAWIHYPQRHPARASAQERKEQEE